MIALESLKARVSPRFKPKSLLRHHLKNTLFKSIEIETYSRCNIKCPTCPVAFDPRPAVKLSEDTWKRIVLDLKRLGFKGTLSPHFYNEPFLDDRLHGLLTFAKAEVPDMGIVVFTNATRLTPDLFRAFSPLVDHFRITVDEPVIRKSIERLAAKLTEEERAKLSTRSIQLNGLTNRGGSVEIKDAELRAPKSCRLPMDHVAIDANGNVVLCYNDYYASVTYGNVNTESLADIWFSDRFLNDRIDIYRGEFRYPICQNCKSNECDE